MKSRFTDSQILAVRSRLRPARRRVAFPSNEVLLKLFYLVLRNIGKKWTMPIRDWKTALTRLTIQFKDRMPQH